jgi:predicted transcriptional regulator
MTGPVPPENGTTSQRAQKMSDHQNNEFSTELLRVTGGIVAAYVGHNPIQAVQLTTIIREVHAALVALPSGTDAAQAGKPQEPAVPIRKSVQRDYIVCLEDGKKLKMLKRYLRSRYDLTPDQYRAKWGLAHDYPMTAPAYAEQRSDIAKKSGLGRKTPKMPSKRAAR